MYLSWYIRKFSLQSFAEFSHLEGSTLSQLWCPFCCSDEKAWGSLPIFAEEWPAHACPDKQGLQSALGSALQLFRLRLNVTSSQQPFLFPASYPFTLLASTQPRAVSFRVPKHFIINFSSPSLSSSATTEQTGTLPFLFSPTFLAKGLATIDPSPASPTNTVESNISFYSQAHIRLWDHRTSMWNRTACRAEWHRNMLATVSSISNFIFLSIQHLLTGRGGTRAFGSDTLGF